MLVVWQAVWGKKRPNKFLQAPNVGLHVRWRCGQHALTKREKMLKNFFIIFFPAFSQRVLTTLHVVAFSLENIRIFIWILELLVQKDSIFVFNLFDLCYQRSYNNPPQIRGQTKSWKSFLYTIHTKSENVNENFPLDKGVVRSWKGGVITWHMVH